jgi:ketosteroid isomerase-like protein
VGTLRIAFALLLVACGASPVTHVATESERAAIDEVVEAWHAAAASSDLDRYVSLMTEDAIFLGTDATERWTVAELRTYAEQPFAEGRGWVMRPVRRDVLVRGDVAWFDEDLETVNLGPARGSGALVRTASGWRIAHYVLSLTVPNERFDAVRELLATPAPSP